MGFTRNYSRHAPSEAPRRAVADAAEFLGFRRFRVLARLAQSGCSEQDFRFCCAFAGVEGYPVDQMLARYRR